MIDGDSYSCIIIEIERLEEDRSAHESPNPNVEDVTEQESYPCIELINSSDEDGPETGKSNGGKRVWRESDKQEWLKIYKEYMQERLKKLPQPLDFGGILGKDIIVGRDGFRTAGRTRRKLKQRHLKDNTRTDLKSDVSKRAKPVKGMKRYTEIRKVLTGSSKHASNKHLAWCHPETTKEHIASGCLEGQRIESDMTVDLLNERIVEELREDCEKMEKSLKEDVLVRDLDSNRKDDGNANVEEYEDVEYLIEDFSSDGLNKTTSKTVKLENLRYNSLKILKYSNICLFKLTKHYFVCFECQEWFKDMKTLRHHANNSHTYNQIRRKMVKEKDTFYKADITDLECKICSVVLNNLRELIDHLGHHNVRLKGGGSSLIPYKLCTELLTCQLCEEVFESRNQLQKHMDRHLNYSELSNSRSFRKTYHTYSGQETSTTLKSFKHRPKLKRPKIRHDEDRFKCNQCPLKFRYDYKRLQHMIEEHKNDSKLFQCEFCPKIFMTVHWLTKHMNCVHQRELYS